MKNSKTLLRLLLAGMLVAGLGLVGCSSDDDNGGGDDGSLVGIWQNTVANVEQSTFQILANGTFLAVHADFVDEDCWEGDGTWEVEGDTLRTTESGTVFSMAWSRSGSTLTITDVDGSLVYTSVAALPSCDDYGWGGNAGLWNGTISASVAGSATDFSAFIYADIEAGVMAFGGNGVTRQIQFTVLGNGPGTYALGAGSMGIYVPDTSDPTAVMTTMAGLAPGTITLTTATATHLVGTFSFTAMDFQDQSTVQITNGTFDISAN